MDKKVKLQIKNRIGSVIFEYETENNTIKKTIEEAIIRNADLCNADLCNANLCNANLCGADLCGANLCKANLCGADLCDADLCDADLCGADLCNANLCNANLCDANLCNANLRKANLCNANLRGANLRNADLCGANLRNADLCGADLCDADLCNANLCDADLCGAVIEYDDFDSGINETSKHNTISKFREKFGINITQYYENHDAFPSAKSCFWKNLLIIRKWNIIPKSEHKKELKDVLTSNQKVVLAGWMQDLRKDYSLGFNLEFAATMLNINLAGTNHRITLNGDFEDVRGVPSMLYQPSDFGIRL